MSPLIAAAFAAGLVSTVNPCGFAMLPAYIGYFLGVDAGQVTPRRVAAVAGAVSAGFVVVFGVTGALVALGLRSIVQWIPWLALVVGVGLVVLGIALLAGKARLPSLPVPGRVERRGSLGGMTVFGMSYAVASLSCTLPIFLSIVASSIAGGSTIEATGAFLAYGAGMGLALVAITVAIAAGRDRLVRRVRSIGRHLETISGWVMVAAGGFIVWYWATVLRSGAVALTDNPLVRGIDRLTAQVAGWVSDQPWIVAVVVGAVAAAGWWALHRSPSGNDGSAGLDPDTAREGEVAGDVAGRG